MNNLKEFQRLVDTLRRPNEDHNWVVTAHPTSDEPIYFLNFGECSQGFYDIGVPHKSILALACYQLMRKHFPELEPQDEAMDIVIKEIKEIFVEG